LSINFTLSTYKKISLSSSYNLTDATSSAPFYFTMHMCVGSTGLSCDCGFLSKKFRPLDWNYLSASELAPALVLTVVPRQVTEKNSSK